MGSPSSDELSSLLSTRAAREISKLKAEKFEPLIGACVQSYKLQMEMQKHFVHEHPKIPVRGRCLKFNLSSMTQECTASMVQCVDGVLRTRGLKGQNRVHEKANKMDHEFQGNC